MYAPANMVSGVEIFLLMRVLSILIYAVVVVTSPGYSIIFTPKVSLVLWVLDF